MWINAVLSTLISNWLIIERSLVYLSVQEVRRCFFSCLSFPSLLLSSFLSSLSSAWNNICHPQGAKIKRIQTSRWPVAMNVWNIETLGHFLLLIYQSWIWFQSVRVVTCYHSLHTTYEDAICGNLSTLEVKRAFPTLQSLKDGWLLIICWLLLQLTTECLKSLELFDVVSHFGVWVVALASHSVTFYIDIIPAGSGNEMNCEDSPADLGGGGNGSHGTFKRISKNLQWIPGNPRRSWKDPIDSWGDSKQAQRVLNERQRILKNKLTNPTAFGVD